MCKTRSLSTLYFCVQEEKSLIFCNAIITPKKSYYSILGCHDTKTVIGSNFERRNGWENSSSIYCTTRFGQLYLCNMKTCVWFLYYNLLLFSNVYLCCFVFVFLFGACAEQTWNHCGGTQGWVSASFISSSYNLLLLPLHHLCVFCVCIFIWTCTSSAPFIWSNNNLLLLQQHQARHNF